MGVPSQDDFLVDSSPMPIAAQGQILCHTRWLALDPYVRALMSGRHFLALPESGQVLPARSVAEVVTSNNENFVAGDMLLLETGIQSYCVSDGADARRLAIEPAPPSTALGVLGMPGLTAYAGLTQLAELKSGETIVVTAATGAVGCMVVQFAVAMGCKVIGIAGGARKCQWARNNLPLEACIDYKNASITEALTQLRPNGIDVYFDNAGGEVLNTIVSSHLAHGARIILCGLISQYNLQEPPPGPNLGPLMGARARIIPLIVYDFEDLWDEFEAEALILYRGKKLSYLEDIREGIENAPAHFSRLMAGENFGKTIIKNNR